MLDFTSTLFLDSVTGIIKRPSDAPALNVWVFLTVFNPEAWVLIVSTSLSLAVFIYWAQNLVRSLDSAGKLNGFVLMFQLLLQLGTGYRVRSVGLRFLFMTVSAFTIVIFSFYTADLTSSMTIRPRPDQIRSFGDIANSPYNVRVFENSAPLNGMKGAKEGTTYNTLYNTKLRDRDISKQPQTYPEAKNMLQVK